MPEHTITITITSDHTTEELVDDLADTLADVAAGYIGDPDQHALYGATIGEISPT